MPGKPAWAEKQSAEIKAPHASAAPRPRRIARYATSASSPRLIQWCRPSPTRRWMMPSGCCGRSGSGPRRSIRTPKRRRSPASAAFLSPRLATWCGPASEAASFKMTTFWKALAASCGGPGIFSTTRTAGIPSACPTPTKAGTTGRRRRRCFSALARTGRRNARSSSPTRTGCGKSIASPAMSLSPRG